ncbi:unnamed protein product [Spodoptera littoralis]|uniref:Uncharacterized protein n=1 Tax=Spodoptera littoralis TaxID=7109 RepID=A0A9P0IBL6_SPOLI|nr:unnamed protein product [Spodoptera littoralis]CAH1644604.1 unnamed protein product [Spodoptera littoralis]
MSKKKQKKIDSAYYVSLIERITTLHGTSHFTSRTGRSLLLWTLAVIGNMMLTIAFIMVIKQKFNENQIVTVINANCKVNQVPFPAVSICNYNMVSMRESQNIAKLLKQYNKTENEIKEFFNALPTLKNYGKSSRGLGSFSDIMAILKHHVFTVDTIMEEVHQKCDSLILYCTFNRKPKDCQDMFSLVKTYEGHCCTFNYAALNDASEIPLLPSEPDPDLEYYDDQNPDGGISTNPTIIATSESGRGSGLSVVLNIEPNDYPSWSPVPYYGVKVLLSDPNDYPETTVLYRYVTFGESVDIKVEPMVFQSDSNVRRVEPQYRGCWFHDEVLLSHTNRYSYETCVTECKMKNYMDACDCVPYKYPREKSTRICDFEDLKCLNNVTVNRSTMEMKCEPICYMECRDKKYTATSDLTPFLADNYPEEITAGRNISELASLQVYFSKSNCNCYKLTLLIDLSYFIATYGGVFSLSFGGSIISLVEITYLFISFIITVVLRIITIAISKNKINTM